MIKGSIHQEDITILSIYVPNIKALKYIKQKLTELKGKVNSHTVIVGDFNTPPSTMDRSSRQRTNKGTADLNNTTDQMGPTDIYRTIFPTTPEYPFT